MAAAAAVAAAVAGAATAEAEAVVAAGTGATAADAEIPTDKRHFEQRAGADHPRLFRFQNPNPTATPKMSLAPVLRPCNVRA